MEPVHGSHVQAGEAGEPLPCFSLSFLADFPARKDVR
jgi:hypothetical protein